MKIVSLLPSSTEICFFLGLGDAVVGVSHECDFPNVVHGRPILTEAKINAKLSSLEIDQQVRQLVGQGLSVYRVHESILQELKPDLIVTQDTCEVCAVSFSEVEEAVFKLLGKKTKIVSLSPMSLADVLGDIVRVGRATGREQEALDGVEALKNRLKRLEERTQFKPKPKVLVLEWIEPPMIAGHWTPELIRLAGGDPILGHDGQPTGPVPWEQIATSMADVILVVPCGFKIGQSLPEMKALLNRPEIQGLPAFKNQRIYIVDGNAYFNRPGPRLVESAEIAASLIHRDLADQFRFTNQDCVHYIN